MKPGGQVSDPERIIYGRRLALHRQGLSVQDGPAPGARLGANPQSIVRLGLRSIHLVSSALTEGDWRSVVQARWRAMSRSSADG